jgi:hypothetical protein
VGVESSFFIRDRSTLEKGGRIFNPKFGVVSSPKMSQMVSLGSALNAYHLSMLNLDAPLIGVLNKHRFRMLMSMVIGVMVGFVAYTMFGSIVLVNMLVGP